MEGYTMVIYLLCLHSPIYHMTTNKSDSTITPLLWMTLNNCSTTLNRCWPTTLSTLWTDKMSLLTTTPMQPLLFLRTMTLCWSWDINNWTLADCRQVLKARPLLYCWGKTSLMICRWMTSCSFQPPRLTPVKGKWWWWIQWLTSPTLLW